MSPTDQTPDQQDASEPTGAEIPPAGAPVETPAENTTADAAADGNTEEVDLIDPNELALVSDQLDDIELVLQNLETRTEMLDGVCDTAEQDATLAERPALKAYRQARIRSEQRQA